MSNLQILLDVRERALSAECTSQSIPFTLAPLDVGDILFQTAEGEPLLLIERKTFADFAASNNDGRYREQRTRLMAARGSGVAILYILEGEWSSTYSVSYGRTTETQLQRLTSRLMMRYGIPVLRSSSLRETAHWCSVFMAQLSEDPNVFHPESGIAAESATAMSTYTESFHIVKKNNHDNSMIAAAMLSAVPGLSRARSITILQTHSLSYLFNLTEEQLATIVTNGKKLGPKLGAKLFSVFHGDSAPA
jgi:ERCC4-type nuclease